MDKSINQLVGEITSLAVLLTQNTKADIFVQYSAHVDNFTISIHLKGWKAYCDPTIMDEISLKVGKYRTEENIIRNLNSAKETLIKLANTGNIDLSSLPYEIEKVKHYKLIGAEE